MQSLIRAVASAAFVPIADMMVSCTYLSVDDQVDDYDPETGTNAIAYDSETISVLLTEISSKEADLIKNRYRDNDPNLFLNTTKKAMIPSLSMPVEPKINDKITIDDIDWDVFAVSIDPAGAVWSIFIRKP